MGFLVCPNDGKYGTADEDVFASWSLGNGTRAMASLGYDVSGQLPDEGFLFDPDEVIARIEGTTVPEPIPGFDAQIPGMARWINPGFEYDEYYQELLDVAREAKRLGVKVLIL